MSPRPLALGAALALTLGCATSPPLEREVPVRPGDRVRVWTTADSTGPAVGRVTSLGPDRFAVDGTTVDRRSVLAVQVAEDAFPRRDRISGCVWTAGFSALAGSIVTDDFGGWLLGSAAAVLGTQGARFCVRPPEWWSWARLPGGPDPVVYPPPGRDPRPARGVGVVCESALAVLLPATTIGIGLRNDFEDGLMIASLVATQLLTGAIQEWGCPRAPRRWEPTWPPRTEAP